MIVAGLGCRPGVEKAAILALLWQAGQDLPPVTHLAAPAFRREVAALHQAATTLGLPLLFVEQAALERVQPLCPTRSETALTATGLASVAEACALAAAGDGARLLRPRISGAGVTCAIGAGATGPGAAGSAA
ncbi:cobalamin biosynthesis protein [Roseomonas sp. ACRSG]|nr:cobalamin biosynthesis protein [Roseomonas sp. ACRSG]